MTPYYDEDGITIYHGDALDVLPTLDPSTVGLVLTDPPYGIGVSTTFGSNGRERPNKSKACQPWPSRDYAPVAGDDQPFDPRPLLRFGRCVLFGANNYAERLPASPSWIVWNRQSGTDDTPDAELAWTNLGGTVRMFSHMWAGYRRDSEIGYHVHPTQKPVALMRWIIGKWTKPDELILDPYMGSGPVARAAMDLGRRYIGIEVEERYCEIAANRLGQGVLAL